ncbi:MAG: hypothetical protein PHE36_14405, partial [Novosphingobium sp.]|nr:hypothetical protein [Novosphingobium sp.]
EITPADAFFASFGGNGLHIRGASIFCHQPCLANRMHRHETRYIPLKFPAGRASMGPPCRTMNAHFANALPMPVCAG